MNDRPQWGFHERQSWSDAPFAQLPPGDPAPWFRQRSTSSPLYTFDTAAGRYIVLCFYGSAGDAQGQEAVSAALANRRHFDDAQACFFGVSIDPADEAQEQVKASMPACATSGTSTWR